MSLRNFIRQTVKEGNLIPGGAGRTYLASAISAYQAGLRSRPPVVLGIGDSNLSAEGAGSGTGAVPKLNQASAFGPIEQVASWLPDLHGLTVRNTAWFGDGNTNGLGVAANDYDPKMSFGSGWSMSSPVVKLFGYFLKGTANSPGYFSYAFGSPITDVEIYFNVASSISDSIGVYNSSNQLIATLNGNGTAASVKQRVTGSFPDGIVKLKNNGSQDCYLAGMLAWNSAEKSLILARASCSGSKVGEYNNTANTYSGMGYYPVIAPDATIVCLTINDINGGTTTTDYNTGLSYIAAQVQLAGSDLVLSTGGNGSGANYSNGGSRGIEAEMRKVGSVYGASVVSMHAEWASWAATNAVGYEFDANHRTRAGYKDQARVYAAVIRGLTYSLGK